MRNPHGCKNDHIYCEHCLLYRSKCPGCDDTAPFKPNLWIARTIDGLTCKCEGAINGCTVVAPFGELQKHLMGANIGYSSGCQFRYYSCPKCNYSMQAGQVAAHLANECTAMEIQCPNAQKGCQSRVKRKNMTKHIRTNCRFVSCQFKHDFADHPGHFDPHLFKCHFVSTFAEATKHTDCSDHIRMMLQAVCNQQSLTSKANEAIDTLNKLTRDKQKVIKALEEEKASAKLNFDLLSSENEALKLQLDQLQNGKKQPLSTMVSEPQESEDLLAPPKASMEPLRKKPRKSCPN